MAVLNRPLLIAALTALLAVSGVAQAERSGKLLYRYTDDRGKVVLNDQLPPEAVERGYDIIRLDGSLVESIAGKPSDEDLQRQSNQEKNAQLREEEAERLRKWDESLLLRYSEVADIEAAKKRAQDDIRVRIAILKGNLNSLKRQVESEQARAADSERLEGKAADKQVEVIRSLKWRIADVEEMVARRQQELQEVGATYDQDISRFSTLIERIGKRR